MQITDKAIHFVTDAMSSKIRKGSATPAVFHSLETGAIASSLTEDAEIIAAALLHDVIEDAGISADTVGEQFGQRVKLLVLSETEDKRVDIPPCESWKERKQEAVALLRESDDIGVKILFLSDKLSNIRSIYCGLIKYGSAFWQRFNQKDPREHHWYYREIADALAELSDTPAWKEYDRLIRITFIEGEET